MRLWSLHPKYLDTKGLLALWREGLLAQKVLAGKTKGYKNHPQLDRFKAHGSPRKAIGRYLLDIWKEADSRGYAFDRRKVKNAVSPVRPITVTRGQLGYEWEHLRAKLKSRNPIRYKTTKKSQAIQTHPLFRTVTGKVEKWEKIQD
jgi:hypothetical protein